MLSNSSIYYFYSVEVITNTWRYLMDTYRRICNEEEKSKLPSISRNFFEI